MSHNQRGRRYNRRLCLPRSHRWTGEQKRTFAEWICQRQMDNETKTINLQTRQNRVVIEILDAEARYTGEVNSAGAQNLPLVVSPRGRRLLRQWDDLDRQIRCLKHIAQLLAPIYFLAATAHEPEFVSNDPITLFFWNQCKMDNKGLPWMDEEVNSQ